MQSIAIVLMCVAAAVMYGIVHDQVTARVCVEYFTIGHPSIFETDDPTLLGIGWGIIATWWAGLLVGVPMAVVARATNRQKRSASSLVTPITWLMAFMGACAATAGWIGWLLGESGVIFLVGPIAQQLPAERHARFLADLWAHSTSYIVGLLGSIVVMVRVWRSRRQAGHDPTLRLTPS